MDQAVYARRLEKAQYIPQVGLQYLFFAPFAIQGLPNYINTVGVNFKWDLYDWGYKRHLTDEKQRAVQQSSLNLDETRSQVEVDLGNRFRKLREARRMCRWRNWRNKPRKRSCRWCWNNTSRRPRC
jgi:outer membrane protein